MGRKLILPNILVHAMLLGVTCSNKNFRKGIREVGWKAECLENSGVALLQWGKKIIWSKTF